MNLELREYCIRSRQMENKLSLFYVIQNERLQCFNGGYLSETNDELIFLLLDCETNFDYCRNDEQSNNNR